jgi:uncharacterized protein
VDAQTLLERAGWFRGRRVDVADDLDFVRSEGFTVTPAARLFLEEYSGLTIESAPRLGVGAVPAVEDKTYGERLKLRRSAAGLTQRELAAASGMKQPLIAALESGSRQPTLAARAALEQNLQVRPSQVLRIAREQVLSMIRAMGGENVRVFGSVARGTDTPGSDIDLLVSFPPGSDIVTLLTLEEDLARLLTVSVDVVSAGGSSPVVTRAMVEAVPL